jgi:geranylgeranylglycerol-phosphate geranylgeranyltransferase
MIATGREVSAHALRLVDIGRLLRPLNVLLLLALVVLGAILAAGTSFLDDGGASRIALAALSAAFLLAAGNSINDVFDVDIDRINRPARPLAAGRISSRTAVWIWAAGTACGILLSFWLSALHFVMAAAAALLLYAYSATLKRLPLLGNLAVALVVTLALYYGGLTVGSPGPLFAAAAFAFLTTLAREVIKDVQDMHGDATAGARTLPLVLGVDAAVRLGTLVLAVTIALTPLPFLLFEYSSLYLLIVLAADLLMLRVIWILQIPQPQLRAGRASGLLKGAMLVGIVALAASGASSG